MARLGYPSRGPLASQEVRKNGRVIDGVLFDLDGTLFDHRGAAKRGVRQLADRFNPVIALEEFLVAWFIAKNYIWRNT
jgi:FMN phosphatase YigB (HAD superfamily)